MPNRRVRLCCAVLLLLGVAPVIWLREPVPPRNASQSVTAVSLPLPKDQALGLFRLTGAWQLTSPNSDFGGFSALVRSAPGHLTSFSDTGVRLDLPEPGQAGTARIAPIMPHKGAVKAYRDVEAAAFDAASGTYWLALEGRNVFMRIAAVQPQPSVVAAPELAGWSKNSGAEAMARLADGRFLILAEGGSAAHEGRLLPGAPDGKDGALRFRFIAPDGYRPTDVTQLPDGRVLILLRELRWPMPPRFGSKLVLADPAAIRAGSEWRGQELASFDETGLDENYEGLAIEPRADGALEAWLISDDNNAATQRTLLLRLEFRLADLPARQPRPKQKAPG